MLFKKEKEVNQLILNHCEKVNECLQTTLKTVEEYLRGNVHEAKFLAITVDQIETDTDDIRRDIIGRLYSGAYLPVLREEILRFLEEMDNIADVAEACCDFFLGQRPKIPDLIKPVFLEILKNSIEAFSPLKEALYGYLLEKMDVTTIREKTKKVGILESLVDKKEWDLTRDIFEMNLDTGHKVHLRNCLDRVVEMSNRSEDAADELEIILIKGSGLTI